MKKFTMAVVLLSLLFAAGISNCASAHPVSFRDSYGIMGHHSQTLSHNQINYSFRHWFASGLHYYRRPNIGGSNNALFATANFLLKRWNAPAFQANIYGFAGPGYSRLTSLDSFAGKAGVQFDIEDRRLYFLVKHVEIFNEDQRDLWRSTARIGIAPYIDGYEGLHSWLILQWQGYKFANERFNYSVTPILRMFYRNLLFEIGHSLQGEINFNYIAHF